jgi:hypothetical protein
MFQTRSILSAYSNRHLSLLPTVLTIFAHHFPMIKNSHGKFEQTLKIVNGRMGNLLFKINSEKGSSEGYVITEVRDIKTLPFVTHMGSCH